MQDHYSSFFDFDAFQNDELPDRTSDSPLLSPSRKRQRTPAGAAASPGRSRDKKDSEVAIFAKENLTSLQLSSENIDTAWNIFKVTLGLRGAKRLCACC